MLNRSTKIISIPLFNKIKTKECNKNRFISKISLMKPIFYLILTKKNYTILLLFKKELIDVERKTNLLKK